MEIRRGNERLTFQLKDEQIIKFQQIFERNFGTKINKKEAHEKGLRLLRLMAIIYRKYEQSDIN